MAIKNQRVVGGGVSLAALGIWGYESGLPIYAFNWGRGMLEAAGDAQTVANLGATIISIIAVVVGISAAVWGFGFFDYVRSEFGWKPRRMGVLDLLNLSPRFGWNLSQSSGDLDAFGHAIRQAGADGSVAISGRFLKNRQWIDNSSTRIHVLRPIDASYFWEHWVYVTQAVVNQKNVYTNTASLSDREEETYCDLHVDRKQGMKWLRTEATLFRDMYRQFLASEIEKRAK